MSNMAKSSLRQGSHGMKLPMCHMAMHNYKPWHDDERWHMEHVASDEHLSTTCGAHV